MFIPVARSAKCIKYYVIVIVRWSTTREIIINIIIIIINIDTMINDNLQTWGWDFFGFGGTAGPIFLPDLTALLETSPVWLICKPAICCSKLPEFAILLKPKETNWLNKN